MTTGKKIEVIITDEGVIKLPSEYVDLLKGATTMNIEKDGDDLKLVPVKSTPKIVLISGDLEEEDIYRDYVDNHKKESSD